MSSAGMIEITKAVNYRQNSHLKELLYDQSPDPRGIEQLLIKSDQKQIPIINYLAGIGNHDGLKIMADYGVNLNNGYGNQHKTPFLIAAEYNRLETAKLLADHGADPYARDIGGYNAIYLAARTPHMKMLEWLTDSFDFDVDLPANNGDTALKLATENWHNDLCVLLLKNGADETPIKMFSTILYEELLPAIECIAVERVIKANTQNAKDGFSL